MLFSKNLKCKVVFEAGQFVECSCKQHKEETQLLPPHGLGGTRTCVSVVLYITFPPFAAFFQCRNSVWVCKPRS